MSTMCAHIYLNLQYVLTYDNCIPIYRFLSYVLIRLSIKKMDLEYTFILQVLT